MTMSTPRTVLIAGGYGLVGGGLARLLRQVRPDVRLILAGRTPSAGEALAQELGNAETLYLDLDSGSLPGDVARADLIVAALQDPADRLIHAAIHHGCAHIGITKEADDVAQTVFRALHTPPRAPLVPLGHWQAGILTLLARDAAAAFGHIETAHLAALYDMADPIGPMTQNDMEHFTNKALIRDNGSWRWVAPADHPREIALPSGAMVTGTPVGVLDVPSVAAFTDASTVRFDLVIGQSDGTARGQAASHDLLVDLHGTALDGTPLHHRTFASDPKGQGHMTALGLLIVAEALLTRDPAMGGGVLLPETLVDLPTALARLEDFGVLVRSSRHM